MSTLRIGIDLRILARGSEVLNRGVGRYIRQQLRETIKRDAVNQYVLLCDEGVDTSPIDIAVRQAKNVSFAYFPRTNQPRHSIAQHDISRISAYSAAFQSWLVQQALDVFHATAPLLLGTTIFNQFTACPMVATLYDLIPLIYSDYYLSGQPVNQMLYQEALRGLLYARRLIAISEATKQDAMRWLNFDAERIDVAYPIADAIFRPLPETANDSATSVQLPAHFLYSVVDINFNKNIALLFGAYARLPLTVRTQYPLVLGGHARQSKQGLLDTLLAQFGITDTVIRLGLVADEDMVKLYNAATVVIFPSRYEGFGLPVLEAMQSGTPVITTTAASLPEVAGSAGITVDPDDAEGMAQAILHLLSSPEERRRRSEQGLRQAAQFSAEQLAAQTIRSYVRAASSSPTTLHETSITITTISNEHMRHADPQQIALRAQIDVTLSQWDKVRQPNSKWSKLPGVLGVAFRAIERVSKLGYLWDIQRQLYQLLLNQQAQSTEKARASETSSAALRWQTLTDHVGMFVAEADHDFEQAEHYSAALRTYLNVDGVFVDVGANSGLRTMLAAGLVGAAGTIFSVEWEADKLHLLDLNVATLMHRHMIRIFRMQPGSTTRRSFQLDDLLANANRIDLLSFDARTATLLVLQGTIGTLQKHKPIVLLDINNTMGMEQLELFFTTHGYTVKELVTHASSTLLIAETTA